MIALKKKAYVMLRRNLMVVLIILGVMMPMLQAEAASTDIYDYITEFSVNDTTWKYGEEMKHVVVGHQEPVSVRYTLYFTKTQWEELNQQGKISLDWNLPSGVHITHVEQDVIAKVEGSEKSIGIMEVVDSSIQIAVGEEHAAMISRNDNIEIHMGVTMQFEEGVYDLGEMVKVEATEAGQASASWNNYMVRINKIAEEDDAKLLEGAYFEIDEYQYSKDAYEYKDSKIFGLEENHVEENGTYITENDGFTTIEDKATLLEGGFEPGYLYVLREERAPIGYLPSSETVKFAFYRYTKGDTEGTLNKIQELNADYKTRYENEGGVAAFGSAMGRSNEQQNNVYVKNRKVPKLQVLKLDATTGEPLADVAFTLQIDAKEADYTAEQYTGLKNAEWKYDSAAGKLTWTMKTGANGVISYPEGTVPYSNAEYTLVEQVPKGYEGYGATRTVNFKMKKDGTVEVTKGSGAVEVKDNVLTIKIENKRVADIGLLKIDEAGNPLEGAVFALYGPQKRDTEDILEKDGKQYYYIAEKTSTKDGKVTFADLSYGDYYIVEKKAPEGYKILEEAYLVKVSEETTEDYVCSIKIVNTKKGPQITETGGRGIGPYIAGGAVLLILGSVFFFLAQKKKQRERARRRARAARRRSNRR